MLKFLIGLQKNLVKRRLKLSKVSVPQRLQRVSKLSELMLSNLEMLGSDGIIRSELKRDQNRWHIIVSLRGALLSGQKNRLKPDMWGTREKKLIDTTIILPFSSDLLIWELNLRIFEVENLLLLNLWDIEDILAQERIVQVQ